MVVVSSSCSSSLLLFKKQTSSYFNDNNTKKHKNSIVVISSSSSSNSNSNSNGSSRRRRITSGVGLRCGALLGGAASSSQSNNSNYVVSFDSSSCITRPLAEILRDLNKRIPDNIIISKPSSNTTNSTIDADQDDASSHAAPKTTYIIPWYHANRMLSFYAPGWCGEIRDVIFSDDASVTVVYRVTIRGSDGEAHRESTGTVSPQMNNNDVDVVAAAEEIAFCRACARFGLGLYLYHDE